ncbi:MAG: hypothetical protein ACK45T_08180 [Pseudanabaena sp.]
MFVLYLDLNDKNFRQFQFYKLHRSRSGSCQKLLPELTITIAGKDGDDAKLYLEKEVKQRLQKLEDLKKCHTTA